MDKKFLSPLFSDKKLLLLLIGNIVTLFICIFTKQSFLFLLWVYWGQSLLLGLFTFIRILLIKHFDTSDVGNGKYPADSKAARRMAAWVMLFAVLIFHGVYLVLLFVFFPLMFRESPPDLPAVFLTVSVFLISNLVSFYSTIAGDRVMSGGKKVQLGALAASAILRIIPIHLTIIVGGFLFTYFRSSQYTGHGNVFLIAFFILVKTYMDLKSEYNQI